MATLITYPRRHPISLIMPKVLSSTSYLKLLYLMHLTSATNYHYHLYLLADQSL